MSSLQIVNKQLSFFKNVNKQLSSFKNVNNQLSPFKNVNNQLSLFKNVNNQLSFFKNVNNQLSLFKNVSKQLTWATCRYEVNPCFWDHVEKSFAFGLFELDWDVFGVHFEGALNRVPCLEKIGIKSNVCGPESFTPDHKPLLGEDPR